MNCRNSATVTSVRPSAIGMALASAIAMFVLVFGAWSFATISHDDHGDDHHSEEHSSDDAATEVYE